MPRVEENEPPVHVKIHLRFGFTCFTFLVYLCQCCSAPTIIIRLSQGRASVSEKTVCASSELSRPGSRSAFSSGMFDYLVTLKQQPEPSNLRGDRRGLYEIGIARTSAFTALSSCFVSFLPSAFVGRGGFLASKIGSWPWYAARHVPPARIQTVAARIGLGILNLPSGPE